jgi:flagellar FliL protein
MTVDADVTQTHPKKGAKAPLILGLALAVVGAGGGFFAVQAGYFGGGNGSKGAVEEAASSAPAEKVDVAFVAIDPLVISLPSAGGRDHLRFSAQLEVVPAYASEVEAIKPRIVDVLNGYLRAVELATLEDPAALTRLRAQMLRRVQVVAGPGRITDFLIMEFVLS